MTKNFISQLPIFFKTKYTLKVYGTIIYCKKVIFNNKFNTKNQYFLSSGLKTDHIFITDDKSLKNLNFCSLNINCQYSKWSLNKIFVKYYEFKKQKKIFKFLKKFKKVRKQFYINSKHSILHFKYSSKILLNTFNSNLKIKKRVLNNIFYNCNVLDNRFFVFKSNEIFFIEKKKRIYRWNQLGKKKIYLTRKKNYWKYFFSKKYAAFGLMNLLKLVKIFILSNKTLLYVNLIYILFFCFQLKKNLFFVVNKSKNKFFFKKKTKVQFSLSKYYKTQKIKPKIRLISNIKNFYYIKKYQSLEIIKSFIVKHFISFYFQLFYLKIYKFLFILHNKNLKKQLNNFGSPRALKYSSFFDKRKLEYFTNI